MAQKPRENKATEGREKVPERWSAQQKTEVVLRLLRGEDLVEVSREVQVSPPELEEWRRVFLETGQQGLRRRGRDPGERELTRTRAKLGELTMRLELARELLEKRGYGDELEKLLKRGPRVSPGTGRLYPLTMICEVWRGGRSTVYAARDREESDGPAGLKKRGPKTKLSDEELVEEIRQVLKESDFLGEGHRKVRARLRAKGIGVGKNRVLRLMRENGLLAPVRRGKHPRGDRSHSGRIPTDVPNELWGTDATRFYTKEDGWCWFFVAVDHCVTDVVGWHVAKKGDRWAALEPIRQGVRTHMDGYAPKIALGLGLRHDWGPQYTAHQFQGELAWLGIRSTASYVGEPECNGVAERFMRTLKEECLYLHDFESLEEARQEIDAFIERYNRGWLLERHGYRTPAQVRQELTLKAA